MLRLCCRDHPSYVDPSVFVNAVTDQLEETRWGLGLIHVSDMPLQNLYNWGLVSRGYTLSYDSG